MGTSSCPRLCCSAPLWGCRSHTRGVNSQRKHPGTGISRGGRSCCLSPRLCCTLTSCLLCKHAAEGSSPLPNSLAMRRSRLLPAVLPRQGTKPPERCPRTSCTGHLPAGDRTALGWAGSGARCSLGASRTLSLSPTSVPWMSGHCCLARPRAPAGISDPNIPFFKALMDFAPLFSHSRRPQAWGDT